MSSSGDKYFKIERYEEYWGGPDKVKEIINKCESCGASLVFSHLPDFRNLLIQETAVCMECGDGNRKVLHKIN